MMVGFVLNGSLAESNVRDSRGCMKAVMCGSFGVSNFGVSDARDENTTSHSLAYFPWCRQSGEFFRRILARPGFCGDRCATFVTRDRLPRGIDGQFTAQSHRRDRAPGAAADRR